MTSGFLLSFVCGLIFAGIVGWIACAKHTEKTSGQEQQARKRLHKNLEDCLNKGKSFGLILFSFADPASISRFTGFKEKERIINEALNRIKLLFPSTGAVSGILRDSDIFVLLPGLNEKDTEKFLSFASANIRNPYSSGSLSISPIINIGWLTHGKDSPAETVSEILRNLDLAVGAAANSEKNISRYTVSLRQNLNSEMDDLQIFTTTVDRMLKHVSGEPEDDGEYKIAVWYQPRIGMRNGHPAILSVEALVRFLKNGKPIWDPEKIFLIAKKTGRVKDLSTIIISEACQAVKSWQKETVDAPSLTFNISRLQLGEYFASCLKEALNMRHITPEKIGVEITERELVDAPPVILKELGTLLGLGIKVIVDSYSNSRKERITKYGIPVHTAKINMLSGMTLVKARELAERAKTSGMKVIAVGVESKRDAEMILGFVDGIQGWCFSPPVPKNQISSLLQKKVSFSD